MALAKPAEDGHSSTWIQTEKLNLEVREEEEEEEGA